MSYSAPTALFQASVTQTVTVEQLATTLNHLKNTQSESKLYPLGNKDTCQSVNPHVPLIYDHLKVGKRPAGGSSLLVFANYNGLLRKPEEKVKRIALGKIAERSPKRDRRLKALAFGDKPRYKFAGVSTEKAGPGKDITIIKKGITPIINTGPTAISAFEPAYLDEPATDANGKLITIKSLEDHYPPAITADPGVTPADSTNFFAEIVASSSAEFAAAIGDIYSIENADNALLALFRSFIQSSLVSGLAYAQPNIDQPLVTLAGRVGPFASNRYVIDGHLQTLLKLTWDTPDKAAVHASQFSSAVAVIGRKQERYIGVFMNHAASGARSNILLD